jgi:hypothetical protein
MVNKSFVLIVVFFYSFFGSISGQDISLLNLSGKLPATYLNPGMKLDSKFNISIAGLNVLLGTDGPSINDLTSKNSLGKNFIDVSRLDASLDEFQNLFFKTDIHTIDLGLKLGDWAILSGHAFKSSANLNYPRGIVDLLANGNAAFIGQTIQIGPQVDINAYNELYLGLQKTSGAFTVGAKFKLLYGVANLQTEERSIEFTTDEEYYQLRFKNDYLVRSSGLLKYNSLDSIDFNYPSFNFDNFFYNNRGFAVDLGASFNIGKTFTLSASALDLGKINWNFFPRKYTSKGEFSFEGLDIIEYFGDTVNIEIKDTLFNLIKVQSSIEEYSTFLNGTFSLGANLVHGEDWRFSALYLYQNNFGTNRSVLSLSAMKKILILELGLSYTISKNQYTNFGALCNINIGPVTAFASSQNIVGLFLPFDSKSASLRVGATLKL